MVGRETLSTHILFFGLTIISYHNQQAVRLEYTHLFFLITTQTIIVINALAPNNAPMIINITITVEPSLVSFVAVVFVIVCCSVVAVVCESELKVMISMFNMAIYIYI